MVLDPLLKAGSLRVTNLTAMTPNEDFMYKNIEKMFLETAAPVTKESEAEKAELANDTVCENVNLVIKSKEKVLLLGDESTEFDNFIFSLLGETTVKEGEIKYRGKFLFADADESTYTTGETLRENILMGETYIPKRYKKVLDVVGMNVDKYCGGDMTEVIEGGMNFSSSERRKIILARMLYVAGDVYVMKDFFGYGESQAEELMYKRVVKGYLWDKTVIIVTKMEKVAKHVDKISVFNNKKVTTYTGYDNF